MKALTEKEIEIMDVLWTKAPMSMRDILENLPFPQPHFNTISTMVRRLEENGFIKHKALGARFFQYNAAISKEEYNSHIQKKAVNKYFNGSYMGFISQLVEQKEISIEELKDLINLVENNNQ